MLLLCSFILSPWCKDGSLTLAPSSQIVYVVWLAFEGVFIYFNILETKNLALEETVERLE